MHNRRWRVRLTFAVGPYELARLVAPPNPVGIAGVQARVILDHRIGIVLLIANDRKMPKQVWVSLIGVLVLARVLPFP